MHKLKSQTQLLLNHLSSVAISVILNAGLFILLLTFLQISEPQQSTDQTIKVIEADENLEDIEDIEELIPPEEVETTDLTENTLDMSEMVAEQLDTSVPQEEAPIASPVVSPVVMQGLAQAMGGVSLDGIGGGAKVATRFMGQSGSGNRFAFVIDYSKSMNKRQLRVMKHELTTALAAIGNQGLATVLFFSGPVWRPDQDAIAAEDRWQGGGGWSLKEGAEPPNPQWLIPNRKNMAALQRMIYETPTTGGTDWFPPLNEVLSMRPRPDIIFFMTDGHTGSNSIQMAHDLIRSLPKDSVKINTVALGVSDEDAAPLKIMAEMTGGNFRKYTDEELVEIISELPDEPDDFSDVELAYLSPAEVRNHMAKGSGPRRPPPEEKDVVSFEID